MAMNRRQYEVMMEQRRAKENAAADLSKKLLWDRTLASNASSDERVEFKRRNREMHAMQNEIDFERNLELEAAEAEKKKIMSEKEEALAREIEKRKSAALREEKLVQRIRAESEELRALEEKLRAAATAKERVHQMEEKKVIQERKKAEHYDQVAKMEALNEERMKAEEERKRAKLAQNFDMLKILEEQIEEKENRRSAALAEFLKEKQMIDEIVAKIEAEDTREEELRRQKQAETRKYVEEYLKEREIWVENERREKEAEDAKILAFQAEMERRETEAKRQKELEAKQKEAVLAEIVRQTKLQTQGKEDMEQLIAELDMEQAEKKRREAEQAAMEKRLRMKLEMMEANEYMKKVKAQKAEELAAEEETFRQQMLAKFAEDDKLEQLSKEKAHRKKMEHFREANRLLEERRAAFAAARQQEKDELAEAQEREAFRRAIIEEARKNLIREKAAELVGYLPRGVLRDEDDLNLLPADTRSTYDPKPKPF